jgi:two-component system, chemotaxis family, sensor histidine kinase and response regulator PixL
MNDDAQIQAQAYGYFLAEAPELLQTIEHEILTLPNEHTTAKVHNLMRALHTLKGAAANVGLATIERIAHDFEDLARVFYNLEVKIDPAIQSLLFDGYSGLHECLEAQMMDIKIDEPAIVERLAATIEQLKAILGDWTEADIALPTAMELGFDIVASIFETTIQEQIDGLSAAISTATANQIETYINQCTEICIGLAESFELPGFLAINHTIIEAIAIHPDRVEAIAHLALANLQQATAEVLAGDRTSGGTVSPDLLKLTQGEDLESLTPQLAEFPEDWTLEAATPELPGLTEEWSIESPIASLTATQEWTIEPPTPEPAASNQILAIASGEAELPAFRAFLTSDRFRTRHGLSPDTQNLFDRILQLCWDWFRHEIHTPHAHLNLELLVTADGLADLDYLHHWIGLLLQGVSTPGDRVSLHLYRQSCVYQVVFAVAKYLADTNPLHQITPEFLTELRSHLQATVLEYKQLPPVTLNERGWLDRIILPHHWTTPATSVTEDPLIAEIWGQPEIASLGTSMLNSETAVAATPDHQQLAQIDRLQALLIQTHHQSIQQHQQLQELQSESHTTELAELIAGSAQLATDLSIALETASQLYQVADRQQNFLSQIASG